MDSPSFQSATFISRTRTDSNLSVRSVSERGAIRKRSTGRTRTGSSQHLDRSSRVVLDQSDDAEISSIPVASLGLQWITPQASPQLHTVYADSAPEAFSTWAVPTPPQSELGFPILSFDDDDGPESTGGTFPEYSFKESTPATGMSSLGFLLPSQYGSGTYDPSSRDPAESNDYIPSMQTSHSSTNENMQVYSHPVSSSPGPYQSRPLQSAFIDRRHSGVPSSNAQQSFAQNRSTSYPYSSSYRTNGFVPLGQSTASTNGLASNAAPSPHLGTIPPYNTTLQRSSSLYEPSLYAQTYPGSAQGPQLYAPAQNLSYPPPSVGNNMDALPVKSFGSETSIRTSTRGLSHNVGSTDAMAVNSRHSAIYYDTRGRSQELHPSHRVQDAVQSSHGRLHGMVTWHTTSAPSNADLLKKSEQVSVVSSTKEEWSWRLYDSHEATDATAIDRLAGGQKGKAYCFERVYEWE